MPSLYYKGVYETLDDEWCVRLFVQQWGDDHFVLVVVDDDYRVIEVHKDRNKAIERAVDVGRMSPKEIKQLPSVPYHQM